MMESLGMTFPIWWESRKIPWFQSPPTKWFIMISCMFFCKSSWFIIISLFHSYPWDGIRSEKNIDEPRGVSSFGAAFEGEGSLLSCLWKNRLIRDAEGRVGQPLDNNYYKHWILNVYLFNVYFFNVYLLKYIYNTYIQCLYILMIRLILPIYSYLFYYVYHQYKHVNKHG